nr:(2Fe-2S)-binding protein [Maliibacterium massiliense]
MAYENKMICNCKQVSLADIERVLHSVGTMQDVEAAFLDVQKQTGCSTGCGKCHDRIFDIISELMYGPIA